MTKNKNKTELGYGIGILSTAIWSSANVIISYISKSQQIPPTVMALWRNILLCVILSAIFLVGFKDKFKLEKKYWPLFLLYGFVIATDNFVANVSVQFNGAAVGTVLLYGSVAFSAIFGYWLYHEKMDFLKVIAIVICITGCVIVSDAVNPESWKLKTLGIVFGLLSGLTLSVYSLMGKETSERGINSWTTMLYSYAFSIIFLILYSVILKAMKVPLPPEGIGCNTLLPSLNRNGWIAMLALAIFPTLIGSGLYVYEMAFIPVNTANLIGTLEPFSTSIQAYIFLGERLETFQIIGGLLIISAVIFSKIYDSRP